MPRLGIFTPALYARTPRRSFRVRNFLPTRRRTPSCFDLVWANPPLISIASLSLLSPPDSKSVSYLHSTKPDRNSFCATHWAAILQPLLLPPGTLGGRPNTSTFIPSFWYKVNNFNFFIY